jgi:dethiobiotin synthetase
MSRGVFVTGTDTGVGKTLAACALIHALAARGVRALPMKPVAAGAADHGGRPANDDTLALMEAAGLGPEALGRVTPVLLREPIAPHIAARREGVRIALAPILAALALLREDTGFLIVEGVGGFCVPLGQRLDTVDLARAVALPVVLVVGLRLGCLNHALLTARALEAAGLPLAGWIANTIDPSMAAMGENVQALRERLPGPLLGHLPHHPGARPVEFASRLAVESLLGPAP